MAVVGFASFDLGCMVRRFIGGVLSEMALVCFTSLWPIWRFLSALYIDSYVGGIRA